MTSAIPQQNHDQSIVFPMSEKTEQPTNQPGLITPPMSPIDTSISSSRPGTTRNSLKITAGQTGLPWLTHDAEGNHFSPICQSSPEEMGTRTDVSTPTSPPPKFLARPKTTSIIRFPTRRRTMQKYIYAMKDGLDPVKVLCDRLKSWQISVKYLNSMFQNIKKVESNTGKGYRKIDAKFTIPSKIETQFKSSDGVKDAWSAFRQYTRENSLIHQDFVDYIENEIAPILHIMLKDTHHHMQGMKQNKQLYTNILWDCRKQADRVISKLNADIYSAVNTQEKEKSLYVIPKRDPLLTKQLVTNTIQELYKQENRLHKEFLETQDKYRQFEQEKIINVYTELFQTFEDYRIQHRLENLEGVIKVATIFNAIETDAEWSDFLHHHENELVKQTAAFKDELTLDFPNISHPLVQPVIMGYLQRNHGKKWTEEYYVLSPVGLLHRYKSQNNFCESPLKPEITMFIPQCIILVNPTSHLLEIRGKTSSGLFGTKKLFELASNQPDILKLWIDILDRMALQKDIPVVNKPVPVDNRSIHSKVLAEDDDHQPETSRSGAESDAEKQQRQMETPMQPIVEEKRLATPQIAPITNTASHIVSDDDEDDDYNFKRQTIEYSTHTPINESPPVVNDSNNPFVTTNNLLGENYHQDTTTSNASTNVPTTSDNGIDINNNASAINTHISSLKSPAGPTREGSDLYWDTATTNLDK